MACPYNWKKTVTHSDTVCEHIDPAENCTKDPVAVSHCDKPDGRQLKVERSHTKLLELLLIYEIWKISY